MRFLLGIIYVLVSICPPSMGQVAQRRIAADLVDGIRTQANFLKDKGHFEVNSLGWSGFDDGSVAAPVDGTGGSPTVVTCARTATTPLMGLGSMLVTHTVADGRGEGCSIPFSVNTKDQAKNCRRRAPPSRGVPCRSVPHLDRACTSASRCAPPALEVPNPQGSAARSVARRR